MAEPKNEEFLDDIAAAEAKLARTHANQERLAKEQRQMQDKLQSGRLSQQESEALLGKLDAVNKAKAEAEGRPFSL